jgi:hypothetical protein
VLEYLLRHIGLLDARDEPHLALTARILQNIDAKGCGRTVGAVGWAAGRWGCRSCLG